MTAPLPCPQTVAALVERAISTRSALLGRCAHAAAVKSLSPLRSFLSTHFINFYSKLDLPGPALHLLTLDPSPSVPSFTALISGLAQNSRPILSLRVFRCMLRSPARPNDFTLPSVLKASASLRDLLIGAQIHCFSVKSGLINDVYVASAAEDMYFKSGAPHDARKMFEEMPQKNVVAWNAMITNAVSDGCLEDAIGAFVGLMESEDLSPNEVSYCAVLNACVDGKFVLLGSQVHSLLVRSGFYANVSVGNSLIDFYGKAQLVSEARLMFNEMRRKDDVSWCSMIVIYAQNGMEEDAFKTYLRARGEAGLVPTDFMVSSILTTCAGLSGLDLGRAVHGVAVRSCIDSNIFVGSALVDMYGKCGSVVDAEKVFCEMPERNIVTWNSMIGGHTAQGNARMALELFDEMINGGMMPNYVTLVCVISACARGGRLKEGLELFETMKERFGIEPRTENYACIVDLLGRAGMEEKAYEFIKSMPVKPSVSVWGSLLGACRIHGKMELGRIAAEKLFELDPLDCGNHVLLSNMFASAGRWKEATDIRKEMKDVGIKKGVGCSWITWKNVVHVFQAKDTSHPRNTEIQAMLAKLKRDMQIAGYMPDARFALYDLEEEEKESEVFQHSEKLALAFALICIPSGLPIRITKNLRVCGDCHGAIKFISGIVGREIIVRDNCRFHHFSDYQCSCGDYW